MKSTVEEVGSVSFPLWGGIQIYMQEFSPSTLPERYARTIEQMTRGFSYRKGYLTVDESVTLKGSSQRRGGLHVDGNWYGEGHGPFPPRHGPLHTRDGIEQLLVLASSEVGCEVFEGEWESIGDFQGGDCSYLNRSSFQRKATRTGVAYVGGACSLLHEALPVGRSCQRTFVRLNLE